MLRVLGHRQWLLLGLVCIATGIVLLIVAVPFVQGWLWILAQHGPFVPPPGQCGYAGSGASCPITTYILVQPPSPYLVLGAYAVATPVIFAVAWISYRGLRTALAQDRAKSRFPRITNLLLVGATGWVALFIIAGFVLDWLAIPIVPWIQYLFFVSILIAPSVDIGVGAAYVWTDARRWLSERPPAGPG
jgi:hypothetical protein